LVLSNAYKGQNVFNLVENLKPIPYHHFEQLLQHNFSIYTRGFAIIYLGTLVEKNFTGSKLTKHTTLVPLRDQQDGKYGTFFNWGGYAYSEPLMFKIGLDEFVYRNTNNKSAKLTRAIEQMEYLFNYTEILPNTLDVMKSVCFELFPPNLNSTMVASRVKEWYATSKIHVEKSFSKLQQKNELEVLSRCNRTALVLPDYRTNQLALNLTTNLASATDVYVGKDILYERGFLVKLYGYITTNMMKRVEGMMESGIWTFWMQVFRNGAVYQQDGSGYELKKPTMSGNIFVLYVLLFFGLGLATVILIVECRKWLCSLVKLLVVRFLAVARETMRVFYWMKQNNYLGKY